MLLLEDKREIKNNNPGIITIGDYTQQRFAENKRYVLTFSGKYEGWFAGQSFLEVPQDLEKMADVINKAVDAGATFDTRLMKASRPLLYMKTKRFFAPELIEWDTSSSQQVVKKSPTKKEKAKAVSKVLADFLG